MFVSIIVVFSKVYSYVSHLVTWYAPDWPCYLIVLQVYKLGFSFHYVMLIDDPNQ
jgi:hypothetical protein